MLGFDRSAGRVLSGIVAIALGACTDDLERSDVKLEVWLTTNEEQAVTVQIVDGYNGLIVSATPAPPHTVTVLGDSLRITPAIDFAGDFDVTYRVAGAAGPSVGIAHIHVIAVNDPPTVPMTASYDVYRTAEIQLGATDIDSTSMTFLIDSPPQHGLLSGTGPVITYKATVGYSGYDSFTYHVSDGQLPSRTGTVDLRINGGSPPVAYWGSIYIYEDNTAYLGNYITDADNDALEVSFGTPAHGAISGAWPFVYYTPDKDFYGDDAFSYTANDGMSTIAGTVQVVVASVNDKPVAMAQAVQAVEDTPLAISLVATDDGPSLTYNVTQPVHGTLTGSGATRTYTPAANYNGPDSFTFSASDGSLTSSSATVTIAVASVPDAPFANPMTITVNEDATAAIALAGGDGDGDPATFELLTQPAHGTLTGAPPTLQYRGAANYNGTDAFTYRVSSGGETTAAATVSITVSPVNDAPTGADATVTIDEDTPVAITLAGSDIEGSALSFLAYTPTMGTLTGTGATRTYTPPANASGTATFAYDIYDGQLYSWTYTITVVIRAVNDAPTAVDDYVATDVDTALAIDPLRNDSDAEGDAFTLDSVAAPAHGDVELVDGKLSYTPAAGFTGDDTFAYTARDANGATSNATVHVGVGAFPTNAPLEIALKDIGPVGGTNWSPLAISADGRSIAFVSSKALVAEDQNNKNDIYVYDRGTRTTTLVSKTASNAAANSPSARPSISGDGRFVVYDSEATDLVPGDTNGDSDVFMFDRATSTTTRVNVSSSGAQASGYSGSPVISEDGKVVAFISTAYNLIADDANGASDIFVRDLTTQTTTRVSVTNLGGEGDLKAYSSVALSADGRYVAFESDATNLVANDTNKQGDVFVRDRVASTTTRVNVSTNGVEATGSASSPSMSRDGRFISFVSFATNLVPGAGSGQTLVRDLVQSTTTWPFPATGIAQQLSGDGRYLVTSGSTGGVALRDRIAAKTATMPSGAAAWRWASISANGRYVVAFATATGSIIVFPNPL